LLPTRSRTRVSREQGFNSRTICPLRTHHRPKITAERTGLRFGFVVKGQQILDPRAGLPSSLRNHA
jgi:hypothetical protein